MGKKSKIIIYKSITARFKLAGITAIQQRQHSALYNGSIFQCGAEYDVYKSLPGKVLDVQTVRKPSEMVDTGLHIGSQAGKQGHKISSLKTSPVCPNNSNSCLGVMIDRVNKDISRNMAPKGVRNSKKVTHEYNLCPRQG